MRIDSLLIQSLMIEPKRISNFTDFKRGTFFNSVARNPEQKLFLSLRCILLFFSSAAPVVVVEAVAVAASAPPLQPPPAAQHWKIQLLLAKNNSKLTWMTPRAPRSESNRPRNNYATFHSIYWNCSNCSPPPLLLLAPFFLPSSFFSSLFFSSLLFLLLLLALEVPIWISTNWPELLPSTFSYSFILIRNQITDKRFIHWKF